MGFEKLWKLSEQKRSRLIVSIDDTRALERINVILAELKGYVVGVKLGFKALLRLGSTGIKELTERWGNAYYFLADFKLADIPFINGEVLDELSALGFDGATIHVFQRGLEEMRKDGPELVAIVAMSHRSPLLDENFESSLRYVKRLGISGVVIGASKKRFIASAKRRGFVVFSPGIGAQGGTIAEALRNGSDFEIVGRSIVTRDDISSAAKEYVEAQRSLMRV